MKNDDTFYLYDLKVEIVEVATNMESICNHYQGQFFELQGENIIIPEGQSFSIYALAAVLPILPAKQRELQENDWMTTDCEVMCPDPNSKAKMRITKTKKRTFKHSETTLTPDNYNT